MGRAAGSCGRPARRGREEDDDTGYPLRGTTKPTVSNVRRPTVCAPRKATKSDTVAEESRWIQITDNYYDGQSWWSPDGNVLYFLSLRDGFWCIWTQRLDAVTKKAVGTPTALQHFHGLRRLGAAARFGYAVASDRLYFPIGETKANIWLAEPQRQEP